ncbi:hypothetical protein ACHMW4_03545 [Mesorhizobium sp. UC22_110]|uniref:hypothetical protein n=1 Tax=unclassified Mesorhizobium TaxID=325217 RepID=UPI00366B7633
MAEDEGKPELGNTKTDYAVMAGRAVSGLLPFAGSFITELIESIVPNQRFDRLVAYVKLLDERIEGFTFEQKAAISKSPEAIDLFEEGGSQAARALSQERLSYIASLVSFGLKGDENDRIEAKRILALLRSIDDDQVIILASNLDRYWRDAAFREKHKELLHVASIHMRSSRDEMDKATVKELALSALVGLGVLRPRFNSVRKGDLPEFDSNTGMVKANGHDITSLGRLVLRRLGLAEEGDL